MDYPAHVYDDDYTGNRWQYGLTNRPPGGGAVPRGFIIGSHRNENTWSDSHRNESTRFRHGTLEYPFALTEKEIEGYELTFVADFKRVPMPSEEK